MAFLAEHELGMRRGRVVATVLALLWSSGCVLTVRELGPNLTCEASACQCEQGWGDCDGEVANGCEQDLTSDPSNCGACGRDCLGGECIEGRCQPVVVYESPVYSSIGIALGSRTLFWREERFLSEGEKLGVGNLVAMPLEGGPAKTLASGVPATALAVGGDTLYWTAFEQGRLWLRAASIEQAVRDVIVVSTDPEFAPSCLVADEHRVYVGTRDYLLEVDPVRGSGSPVAAWQSPCAVMVREASFVAWMDSTVRALQLFDVQARQERLFSTGDPSPTWRPVLAAGERFAYWAEGTDPWIVRAMSLETGEPFDVASLPSAPSSMVFADPLLYVGRAGAGVIEALGPTGGEPVVLATGQASLASLQASPSAIYFSSGRRIKLLAR